MNDEWIDKFREELRKPFRERYFPEDELVYVFDAAGDVDDDYLRNEALLLGAKLYPDSVKLLERRAVFYLDSDIGQFRAFMDDNSGVSSTLLDILKLNLLEGVSIEDAERTATELLENINFSEDEEVIQFIGAAHALGLHQWLINHFDDFKIKAAFQETVLYEYGYLASEAEELSELAVKALEELTELEPYAAEYWNLLSLSYLREGRTEDALSAVEYALAIEPMMEPALRTKFLIGTFLDDVNLIKDSATRILEICPDDANVAAEVAIQEIDADKAAEFIDSLTPKSRANRVIIKHSIDIHHPRLDQILAEAFDNGIDDIESWREFADYAYEDYLLETIPLIFRIYEEKSGEPLDHDFLLLKIMFDMESYPMVINMFMNESSTGTLRRQENFFEGYTIYIVSLLRTGDIANARTAVEELIHVLSTEPRLPGSELEKEAVRSWANDILKHINSKRKTNWENIHPLNHTNCTKHE